MSLKYLTKNVYDTGILTDNELLSIIRAKSTNNQDFTTYKMDKRRNNANIIGGDGFDDANMYNNDEDDDDDMYYKDITEKIRAASDSGTYSNVYAISCMYRNDTSYWCTLGLSGAFAAVPSDVWIIFDCKNYQISKIEIKLQISYACSTIKIYSSDSKNRQNEWDKITKKVNMSINGQFEKIQIMQMHQKFIKMKFENWTNGYVGIERIRFYQFK